MIVKSLMTATWELIGRMLVSSSYEKGFLQKKKKK